MVPLLLLPVFHPCSEAQITKGNQFPRALFKNVKYITNLRLAN